MLVIADCYHVSEGHGLVGQVHSLLLKPTVGNLDLIDSRVSECLKHNKGINIEKQSRQANHRLGFSGRSFCFVLEARTISLTVTCSVREFSRW